LLGNGDGTFEPATQSPPVHTFERFITAADFNHDGSLDLVMQADGSVITVLLGNGDGTFQDGVATTSPFNVTAIGVGDFNRDGRLDLATSGTFGSGYVNILLGNGDGTFQAGASYPVGSDSGSIAVADLNGDHKLDLAIANSGNVSVLLGNGDGTFQAAVQNSAVPDSVVVADMNGDGKPDLVAANALFPPGAAVFLGKGDGTFGSATVYKAAGIVSYAAVGDFNGDGKKDVVVTDNNSNVVIVMLNTGNVSFSPTTPLIFNKQTVGTTSAPQKVTLTNSGKTALTISQMKAAGQFAMISTCHASVAVGGKCTISVTFSPQSKGAKQGTVTILDSASSKPMVIELSGTGT
ncbi:MAG: FG-GAP-like repeat-containing protein, partial [Candidatus Sulfotelmatobacter sp.]